MIVPRNPDGIKYGHPAIGWIPRCPPTTPTASGVGILNLGLLFPVHAPIALRDSLGMQHWSSFNPKWAIRARLSGRQEFDRGWHRIVQGGHATADAAGSANPPRLWGPLPVTAAPFPQPPSEQAGDEQPTPEAVGFQGGGPWSCHGIRGAYVKTRVGMPRAV